MRIIASIFFFLLMTSQVGQARVGSRTTFTIAFNAGLSQARYEFQRGKLAPCDANQVLPKLQNWCQGVYPFWRTRIQECYEGAKYFVQQQMLQCNPGNAVCQMRPDRGNCDADITRWYFNPSRGRCEQFRYTGCGGNDNNFGSQNRCQAACVGGANIGCPTTGGSCPTDCGGLVQGTVVGVVWRLCPERLRPIVQLRPPNLVTITHQCELEMLRECYVSARNSFASKKQAGVCENISKPGPLTSSDRQNIWGECSKEIAKMISDAQIP